MTELLNEFLSGSAAWGVLLTLAAHQPGHRQGNLQPAAAGQHLRHHPAQHFKDPLCRLQGQCCTGQLPAAAGHHQSGHSPV